MENGTITKMPYKEKNSLVIMLRYNDLDLDPPLTFIIKVFFVFFQEMNTFLADKVYFVNNQLTLADIFVYTFIEKDLVSIAFVILILKIVYILYCIYFCVLLYTKMKFINKSSLVLVRSNVLKKRKNLL